MSWNNEKKMVDTLLKIPDDYIFVFGSNTAGRHGAGAALWARTYRKAVYGRGLGLQGTSYAIPTKDSLPDRSLVALPLDAIAKNISDFLEYAAVEKYKKFYITRIGCGLAGYKDNEIAPLFVKKINDLKLYDPSSGSNCYFDPLWKPFGLQILEIWGQVSVEISEGE
jgi:hypothetical protein